MDWNLWTLAETGGGFDGLTLSVAAIAAVGVAVASAIRAFRAGEEKGKQQRTKIEPTPLPVSVISQLATKDEMKELEGRLVGEIRKLETQVHGERSVARTANSNIHHRLDTMAEKKDLVRIHERIDTQAIATASAAAALHEVKNNVNQLLSLALTTRKPPPRT
jgi:hypothetical protein